VFDFIEKDVAEEIFESMLDNVIVRVAEEQGISLRVGSEARSALLTACTDDLSNGGRGIGARLETSFINPLARALFTARKDEGADVEVIAVEETPTGYRVDLR
jgi:ATP-dependent Clp protease ATP-binding subunit ClpA